jgi:single-strand DNA-binding protein
VSELCALADCGRIFVGSPYGLPPNKRFSLALGAGHSLFGCPEKTGQKAKVKQIMYLNRIQIIGFTGKDAESRNIRGTHKVSFSVCTNESWQDEKGDWQQKATWHNCVVWGGRVADFASTLEKGAYLLVEGKLVKREYEREIQARKSSVKVPALAVEIAVSKIVKLARPAKAHDEGHETGEQAFSDADESEAVRA